MNSTNIYAIRDLLSEAIVGGLHLYKHHAAAIRFFGDIATQDGTIVQRHIHDHELVHLGVIVLDTGEISAKNPPVVILTGEAYTATANLETLP